MRTRLLAALLLLATVATPARHAGAADLAIERPWARPTAPRQANGAAYLRLRNAGAAADRLVGAATDVARVVELHTHSIDAQGVARMRPVPAIEVPAGGEAVLAPGGLHLMLLELKAPLRGGQAFPLTLRFERAGEIRVEVAVGQGGGAAAGEATGAGQAH